jgi:hypothetical protein
MAEPHSPTANSGTPPSPLSAASTTFRKVKLASLLTISRLSNSTSHRHRFVNACETNIHASKVFGKPSSSALEPGASGAIDGADDLMWLAKSRKRGARNAFEVGELDRRRC